MLGIEDYGSDEEGSQNSPPPPQKVTDNQPPKVVPKNTNAKLQRPPKKITISLPSISASKDDSNGDVNSERPSKKRKTGAGASSLLSMLPTPKESNPIPSTQRVLGGGSGRGLDFQTRTMQSQDSIYIPSTSDNFTHEEDTSSKTEDLKPAASTLFRPTSLAKGKRNISIEETNINLLKSGSTFTATSASTSTHSPAPASDFFSFSSLSSSSRSNATSKDISSSAPSTSALGTFSAAPDLPTFAPPEPTQTDQYPGYYQLPSGAWAAHDVEYYGKFMKKWENEYNAQVRALEKGTIKGFEGLQNADVEEIDALKEMEKAKKEIQEREEKKAVTRGAAGGPVAPKMNISASKMSGVARSRHQLSTLLKEAYENREALEERIAQGKRNRKEAGNKYGF